MNLDEYNEQRTQLIRKQQRFLNSLEHQRIKDRIEKLDEYFERTYYGHYGRMRLSCEKPLTAFGVGI